VGSGVTAAADLLEVCSATWKSVVQDAKEWPPGLAPSRYLRARVGSIVVTAGEDVKSTGLRHVSLLELGRAVIKSFQLALGHVGTCYTLTGL
jgi:hypothetical protein